jgi:hypothetical protein
VRRDGIADLGRLQDLLGTRDLDRATRTLLEHPRAVRLIERYRGGAAEKKPADLGANGSAGPA